MLPRLEPQVDFGFQIPDSRLEPDARRTACPAAASGICGLKSTARIPRSGNARRGPAGRAARRDRPRPAAPPRPLRRRDAGFTLVELILVLLLIALGSAFVIPRAAPLAGRRMDASMRQVLAASRHARSLAVTSGAGARLCVDAGERRWWLEVETDPFENPGVYEAPGDEWGAGATLPEGVSLEDPGTEAVRFRPDGTADDALLVFAGADGERRAVEIRGLTGLSRILEEEEMEYRLEKAR
jgi:prepilin-type N-terminal cleavage/methylation domain-containing protein